MKETNNIHLVVLANGQDYHIQKWLKALAVAGLQVSLLSFQTPDNDIPHVHVEKIERTIKRRTFSILDYYLGSIKPLKKQLDRLKPDIVWASFATTYGWLGRRTGFAPQMSLTWSRDATILPFKGWRRFFFRFIVSKVLKDVAAITTDGPAFAEIVKTKFPEVAHKVFATTWGIQLKDYQPIEGLATKTKTKWSINPDAPIVVSGRGVRDWYRPEIVLPALIDLLKKHQTVHVIVLTLTHERPNPIQALLDELNEHPRAHVFDRFLSTEEMRAVWSVADILISVPHFDGISEGIIEGMYAGAIPIVNDIPSNKALLLNDHRGFKVKDDSANGLTETIMQTLDQLPNLKKTVVPANKQWVQNEASVEATANQVVKMIRSVLNKE